MPRGVYTAQYKIAGLNASKTLMYLTAPSTQAVEIIGVTVTNESNATNQQMAVSIDNITTLGTPTATSVTPAPHEKGDQAAGSTVKANVTASEPTYGTSITREGAASVVGYRHEPAPEERLIVQPGTSVGIRMLTTPVAMDTDIRLTFREIG
jgi:hypothetical protein